MDQKSGDQSWRNENQNNEICDSTRLPPEASLISTYAVSHRETMKRKLKHDSYQM